MVEQTSRGERGYDIYSRLLVDRIIFSAPPSMIRWPIPSIAQMLFLQMSDPKKDIHIYINSPGGHVTAGLAIYDTMQFLTCDVNTYCIGQAASMGAVLLSGGTTGKRFALPHANVMIHQVNRRRARAGNRHGDPRETHVGTQENPHRHSRQTHRQALRGSLRSLRTR